MPSIELMGQAILTDHHGLESSCLGIVGLKIRCQNVEKAYGRFLEHEAAILGDIKPNGSGQNHFYLRDPEGNLLEVIEDRSWFSDSAYLFGGIMGVIVHVNSIGRCHSVLETIFGRFQKELDEIDRFQELFAEEGSSSGLNFRKVIYKKQTRSQFLGNWTYCNAQLEFVECLDKDKLPNQGIGFGFTTVEFDELDYRSIHCDSEFIYRA